MDRVAHRGPLARAPGAIKSHNAKKLKGGTLWGFFNIHSVAKHQKIERGENFYFRKKISQRRKKTLRGDPLGFSNIHSDAKHQKMQGGPFGEKIFFEKKVSQCRKKMKGGTLWSRPVWYVTRKNLFGSVR